MILFFFKFLKKSYHQLIIFPKVFQMAFNKNFFKKKLTINSIVGLRSNHKERRGLMKTKDDDDDPSCSSFAFILSIPLVPG